MKQTKYLSLALALLLLFGFACTAAAEEIETIVTIITTPEQTKLERPACFPDPRDNYIPLPDTENIAAGKKVSAGLHNDVYVATNVNDSATDTYWESKGFPAEMTFTLDNTYTVSTVAVLLNPSSVWEPRSQEIAVSVSMDGENFTTVAAASLLPFDPATGNRVRIDFPPCEAAYVRVTFTKNTSSRTGGAQAAEIQIY